MIDDLQEAELLEILSEPIAFHPILARVAGSVKGALLLGQALYWTKVVRRDPS